MIIENFAKPTLQSIKESNNPTDPPNLLGLSQINASKVKIITFTYNNQVKKCKIINNIFIGQILLIENEATLCILHQVMFTISDETVRAMSKEALLL